MFNLTSYDVPKEIRDRINACGSLDEVIAIRDSVKAPNACKPGNPDLTTWWACQSVIDAETTRQRIEAERANAPVITEHQTAVMDWVMSDDYDNE